MPNDKEWWSSIPVRPLPQPHGEHVVLGWQCQAELGIAGFGWKLLRVSLVPCQPCPTPPASTVDPSKAKNHSDIHRTPRTHSKVHLSSKAVAAVGCPPVAALGTAISVVMASACPFCSQETYLMKHMSKHTVVEHLVSHHSPQRTESPGIPVRISLI